MALLTRKSRGETRTLSQSRVHKALGDTARSGAPPYPRCGNNRGSAAGADAATIPSRCVLALPHASHDAPHAASGTGSVGLQGFRERHPPVRVSRTGEADGVAVPWVRGFSPTAAATVRRIGQA